MWGINPHINLKHIILWSERTGDFELESKETEEYIICPKCGESVNEFIARGTCAFKVCVNTSGISTTDHSLDDVQVELLECTACGGEIDRNLIYK